MTDIQWMLDKTIVDPDGNRIRIMQRELRDLDEAIITELAPFFHEPTFIQVLTASDGRREITEGRLCAMSKEGAIIRTVIENLRDATPIVCITENPLPLLLTVWRLNDNLEALQVNMEGTDSQLYMQLGLNQANAGR